MRRPTRPAWLWQFIVVITSLAAIFSAGRFFQSIRSYNEVEVDVGPGTCSDLCFKARDGVCDEGRQFNRTEGSEPLLCDLGADCSDCGPWLGPTPVSDPPGWDGHPGPVSWTRSRNFTMCVRRALPTTNISYLMAITEATADPDVSAMLEHYGAMEGGVTWVLHEALHGHCVTASGQRRMVLDVGANMGYYTLAAARLGCNVVAWEPVPLLRAYLAWGIAANGLHQRVQVRSAALAAEAGRVSISLAKLGTYWGLASVDALNLHTHEVSEVIHVPAETLDDWATSASRGGSLLKRAGQPDVLLLKLDIEGYEPQVVQGAAGLLAGQLGRVEHVLVEYSPGIVERRKLYDAQVAHPLMLLALARAGYRMALLPTSFAAPWPPKPLPLGQALPPFEEVTAVALEHDVKAAKYRKHLESGPEPCKLAPELQTVDPWRGCNEWAYAAHPKGFRSAFGFNTNVWATRNPSSMRLAGNATLFAESQDMRVWTSELRPGIGIGLLDCSSLGEGHRSVFRCPCTKPEVCGKQEETVKQLAAQGRMPMDEADRLWLR